MILSEMAYRQVKNWKEQKEASQFEGSSESTENFSTLFEKFPMAETQLEGHLVEGVVIAIKKNILIINLGLKMTIEFPLDELSHDQLRKVKVGDSIPFVIEQLETHDGEMVLNYEKAIKQIKHKHIWSTIKKNKEHVNGIVLNHVEGGFSVGLAGIVAFLPKDQVPPIKYKKKSKKTDRHSFVGSLKTFSVLSINASRSKKNIILSRTEAIRNMIRSIKKKELNVGV